MVGLSTDQTYSLFETLFQVSSDSEEFFRIMKEYDDYAKKIYDQILYLRSYILSRGGNKDRIDDEDDDANHFDELLLQGKSKRINSGEKSITAGSKLVVFDLQKKVLQVIIINSRQINSY